MLFKSQPKLVNIILNQRKNKSQKFLNKALLKVVSFYCICISQLVIKKKKKKTFLLYWYQELTPRAVTPPAIEAVRKFQEARVFLALFLYPSPSTMTHTE